MLISACATTTMPGGATERAICEAWGGNLPTRSRADTAQTQEEIQRLYAVFAATCPDQEEMIP